MFHFSLPFGFSVCQVVCLAAFPAPSLGESAPYVPYSGIVTGTTGADPVTVTVRNAAGARIVCSAALAHWYSQDLGTADSGGMIEVNLWHDPETGVVSLLNPGRDRMPVEAVFCGLAGSAHATRGRIPVPQAAGEVPRHLSVTCRNGENRLDCMAD